MPRKHKIRKGKIFNKWCCDNWISTDRGMKLNPYHMQKSAQNGLKI